MGARGSPEFNALLNSFYYFDGTLKQTKTCVGGLKLQPLYR